MLGLAAFVSLFHLYLVTKVSAHGYVQEVTLGSTKYTGYLPSSDPLLSPPPPRIIRRVPGIGPVLDIDRIDVQCNGSPTFQTAPALLVGQVAAGDFVKFNWTAWPVNHEGPILTYMARAPSDVTKWNPGTDAVWFKIDHTGKDTNGKWAAADLLVASKSIYTVRIPPNLRPGQYIIRHEIVDLHVASKYPGIQLFPSCVQVEVTGAGDAFPTSFVSFPGAYKATTPGVVWDIAQAALPYPIPGPDVWTGGD